MRRETGSSDISVANATLNLMAPSRQATQQQDLQFADANHMQGIGVLNPDTTLHVPHPRHQQYACVNCKGIVPGMMAVLLRMLTLTLERQKKVERKAKKRRESTVLGVTTADLYSRMSVPSAL
ncbi:hypothetical protein ABBQ32_001200 [Trebouxia sp. C0010 RCD-2024]